MLLSNYLLSGGVKPYLEYGWVTAPNTAGQTITANTITTLTIDTEVADTGNNGSISGNQITLAAGTYYFEASVRGVNIADNGSPLIFSLFNVSDSVFVTRTNENAGVYSAWPSAILKGQFTILSSKIFELRLLFTSPTGSLLVRSGYSSAFSNSTAGADQRTTIKLWKLA